MPTSIGFVLGVPLVVLFLLPALGLLLGTDFQSLGAFPSDSVFREALIGSLLTSLAATLCSVVFGLPLALFLARAEGSGWVRLEGLLGYALIFPPAAAGLGLGVLFAAAGVDLGNRGAALAAVTLAQVFVAAPLFVIAAIAGFRRVPEETRDAARLLGIGGGQFFRTMALPIAAPLLLLGLLACWVRALGEFGASLLVSGGISAAPATLPLALATFQNDDAGVASAAGLILLMGSLLLGIGIAWCWQKAKR